MTRMTDVWDAKLEAAFNEQLAGITPPKDPRRQDDEVRAHNHEWSIRLPWKDIEGREL